MTAQRLLVVGDGSSLDTACRVANSLGLAVESVSLPSGDRFNFDLSGLIASFSPGDCEVFVALDERAVNFARNKLLADIGLAGYRLTNLISPSAALAPDVKVGRNLMVEDRATVGDKVTLGTGTWIGPNVVVGNNCRIGGAATLMGGVVLGRAVEIGRGTTIGTGLVLADGARIGRHCEILVPLPQSGFAKPIPDTYFVDSYFPWGAQVFRL